MNIKNYLQKVSLTMILIADKVHNQLITWLVLCYCSHNETETTTNPSSIQNIYSGEYELNYSIYIIYVY